MTESIPVLYVGGERGESQRERLEAQPRLEVVSRPTATDGFEYVDGGERTIEAVISDTDLPDADGLGFLERVRDRRPDLPVVLVTRGDSDELLSEALSVGITDCLPAKASVERYALLAGRLEDAVERRRAKERLDRAENSVPPRLYEVTTDTTLTVEQRIERVLEIGTEEFGYGVGYFTRIDDGIQEIRTAVGDNEAVRPGRTDPLEETYCRRVIETDETVLVGDALEDGWGDDPAYEAFGLRCYLGTPVEVDGDVYGTFCFGDDGPRNPDVLEAQASTVKLLARWVGYELQRRQYERELERQNERLEEFVSAVSHDLRNPLEIATGYLELFEKNLEDDGDHVDHLETVDRALERMNVLIEDTLTLAREGRRVDEFEDVSLGAVTAESWEVVDGDGAGLEVTTEGTVSADERRLRRVLENLFRNSIEHGGNGVTIEVGDLESEPGFYVADDGPGIPPAERDRVFDRGYSTGNTTGFGLAIVEKIVTAHGWTVDVTESDDGGARFEIRTDGNSRRRELEPDPLRN